jgi:peptidoglycan/LPS O-acetylase OafA/YrhL
MEKLKMTRPAELPTLTIARFFAAIAVVWFHYGRFVPMPHWLMNVTMSGYVWVTFFFMLSGFILVYVARDLDKAAGRREFYVRRVARIVPVYLLAWGLFAVCQLIDPAISLAFWLKTTAVFGGLGLTFAQSWVPGAAQYWNTPAWSLSCEAFFYLCFPAIFLYVLTMKRRALLIALLGLVVVNVFAVVVIDGLKENALLPGTAFATTWGKFLSFHPAIQMIVFLIGVVLGQLFVMGGRLKHAGWWLALSVIALAMLALLEYGDVRRDLLLVPAFALLIYSLACLPNLISGKAAAVGVLLGNASYGIYILQEPLWYLYCSAIGIPRWGSTVSPTTLFAFLALLVIVCVVIYVQFERPVEKAIKVRFGLTRRAPASAVVQKMTTQVTP